MTTLYLYENKENPFYNTTLNNTNEIIDNNIIKSTIHNKTKSLDETTSILNNNINDNNYNINNNNNIIEEENDKTTINKILTITKKHKTNIIFIVSIVIFILIVFILYIYIF